MLVKNEPALPDLSDRLSGMPSEFGDESFNAPCNKVTQHEDITEIQESDSIINLFEENEGIVSSNSNGVVAICNIHSKDDLPKSIKKEKLHTLLEFGLITSDSIVIQIFSKGNISRVFEWAVEYLQIKADCLDVDLKGLLFNRKTAVNEIRQSTLTSEMKQVMESELRKASKLHSLLLVLGNEAPPLLSRYAVLHSPMVAHPGDDQSPPSVVINKHLLVSNPLFVVGMVDWMEFQFRNQNDLLTRSKNQDTTEPMHFFLYSESSHFTKDRVLGSQNSISRNRKPSRFSGQSRPRIVKNQSESEVITYEDVRNSVPCVVPHSEQEAPEKISELESKLRSAGVLL